MDHLSSSSGRNSGVSIDYEQSKLPLDKNCDTEMTLMRLRRLTKTVMCKSERQRFEARTLQRSNIIKHLESHLMHPSEQISSLALELLCSTIPRLGDKTDCLLKPLLPKVFQYLKNNNTKEMKTRALHFLRGYFHHTRKVSGFIDNFVKLGIQNSDSEIQISCCLGLSIIFDQELGNSLYSQLIIPVANILMKKDNPELNRAAYRALKCIHKFVNDTRFLDLINMAHPDAAEFYENMYILEENDYFLTMEDNDCSRVVLEYQIKRNFFNLNKDFGVLDPFLLHQIHITRNCEKAIAVENLFTALKQTAWTAEDLDPHILDFLKVISSFVSDTNRLVQMYGFDILKEIINRLGFLLAPYIHWVTEILGKGLICENSKIKLKVYRVLYKLMRCVHPMTVIWNFLNKSDNLIKEAVIMLVQNMLGHFSYHEFDMVDLCNYLGHNLEDTNIRLKNCSKDCIILILNILKDCPAYHIKTEAIKALLKNHNLSTQTLKDIGIIGNILNDDYLEGFESYSDEQVSDKDSFNIPNNDTDNANALLCRSISTANESNFHYSYVCSSLSLIKPIKIFCKNPSCSHLKIRRELMEMAPSDISIAASHRNISTAGESDARCDDAYRKVVPIKSIKGVCECFHAHEKYKSIKKETNKNPNLDAHRNKQSKILCGNSYIDLLNSKIDENTSVESSLTSSIEERILSTDSTASRSSFIVSFREHQKPENSCQSPSDFIDVDRNEKSACEQKESDDPNLYQVVSSDNSDAVEELNSNGQTKRCTTRFYMKPEVNYLASYFENQAQENTCAILESNSPTTIQQFDSKMHSKTELSSGVQSGIQVDVLNNSIYNFNIMTIDHTDVETNSNYTENLDLNSLSELEEAYSTNNSKDTPSEAGDNCRHHVISFSDSSVTKLKTCKSELRRENSKAFEFTEGIHCTGKQISTEEEQFHLKTANVSLNDEYLYQEAQTEIRRVLSKEKDDMPTNSSIKETGDNTQEDNLVQESNGKYAGDIEEDEYANINIFQEENDVSMKPSSSCSKNFDGIPSLPKIKQLPRIPACKKSVCSSNVEPKLKKIFRKNPTLNKRKENVKPGAQLVQMNVMNSGYTSNVMTIDQTDTNTSPNSREKFCSIHSTNEYDEAVITNNSEKFSFATDGDYPHQEIKSFRDSSVPKLKTSKLEFYTKDSKLVECSEDIRCSQSQKFSQKSFEKEQLDIEPTNDLSQEALMEETTILNDETDNMPTNSTTEETYGNIQGTDLVKELNDKYTGDIERGQYLYVDTYQGEDNTSTKPSTSCSKYLDETPFMPKSKELPRTPVLMKSACSSNVQPKLPKYFKRKSSLNKREANAKNIRAKKDSDVQHEESNKSLKESTDEISIMNATFIKSCGTRKYNSPSNWAGCQWRRDLEYASKALPCNWIEKFESKIEAMKPFPSADVPELEMKKAIEDLHGKSWTKKEEAMLIVIQLAKHHPKVVQENTSKIVFVLCNEVKNFRQSVAGKAVLTIGHLYGIMGKYFENKLRLVISALLAKSGNRTLAAYFRLVIKTLFKIMNSSPQKAAMAFMCEGCKHTNKAVRETAAQFLTILTEKLGPENSLTPSLSSHMLKCAVTFAFDSSALNRHCGKRMLKVFMGHPDFEKMKSNLLDIDIVHKLSEMQDQITTKGIGEDILPISLID